MPRLKKPRLTTRNWEALMDSDAMALPSFEKLNRGPVDEEAGPRKPTRSRQSFHRSRFA